MLAFQLVNGSRGARFESGKMKKQINQVDRRTVLKATAWGSAAVVFSIAAPAASASPNDLTGAAVKVSMTTQTYVTSGASSTNYAWMLLDSATRPQVYWTDNGTKSWNTGTMTATYRVTSGTNASRISTWTACTPYKLNSDSQDQATGVVTNATLLQVGNVITTSDGYVWTCTRLTTSGTGSTLKTDITFTANGATSVHGLNTVFMPRIGYKVDYSLTTGSNKAKPFKVNLNWQAASLNVVLPSGASDNVSW